MGFAVSCGFLYWSGGVGGIFRFAVPVVPVVPRRLAVYPVLFPEVALLLVS